MEFYKLRRVANTFVTPETFNKPTNNINDEKKSLG